MSSTKHYDTIVIGGGVVGASAAYHLARAGANTLLLDNHDAGRATDAGAGIIAPETAGASLPSFWFDLALPAGSYYPTLIQQLVDEGGGDTGYHVCGELIVAADEDELEGYEHKKAVVLERQRMRNFPPADDLREISPDDARALFPALKPMLKALYCRASARVDGRMLAVSMLTAAQNQHLNTHHGRADRLLIDNGHVSGVETGGDAIHAGNVIIAGGAWSAAFGEQLGCTIPVQPQRGQIIHLRLSDTDTGDWPVVDAFHGHYLVCWPDSRVVAGATRETGSGFAAHSTAAGVREVLDEALRVAPGLANAALGEIRVGLRPRTTDDLPVLGDVPGVGGIYLATGHGAIGLHLGPFSGKLAAEWVLGKQSEVDISAFNVSRFQ
jgi:D-amino-acid dehydrogenase